MKKNSIGLGIVTYQREQYFDIVYNSIPKDKVNYFCICNDGFPYSKKYECDNFIQHKENKGVTIAKNDCLRFLLDCDCEHFFLLEDDCYIKNKMIFEKYIETFQETNIPHLMFNEAIPNEKRIVVKYKNNVIISLYKNPQGAFLYIHRKCLDKVGVIDENYSRFSLFEHIDWAYSMVYNKLIPPFWWFADLENSIEYISSITEAQKNSVISSKSDYNLRYRGAAEYFIKKWGFFTNQIKDSTKEEVIQRLKEIKNGI